MAGAGDINKEELQRVPVAFYRSRSKPLLDLEMIIKIGKEDLPNASHGAPRVVPKRGTAYRLRGAGLL